MKRIAVFFSSLLPLPLFAAGDFRSLIFEIVGVINLLIELLGGVAILMFFWGIAQYIRSAGDEKKLDEGKKIMVWGVVGLFVLVCMWGILGFLYAQLGFDCSFKTTVYLPTQGSGSSCN